VKFLELLNEDRTYQIKGLSFNSVHKLFIPVQFNDMTTVLDGGIINERIKVYPTLESALKKSNIVYEFMTKGKYLKEPDWDIEVGDRENIEATMAAKYPDSRSPLITWLLLKDRPVIFEGIISPNDFINYYLVVDGKPKNVIKSEIISHYVNKRADVQRNRQKQMELL